MNADFILIIDKTDRSFTPSLCHGISFVKKCVRGKIIADLYFVQTKTSSGRKENMTLNRVVLFLFYFGKWKLYLSQVAIAEYLII